MRKETQHRCPIVFLICQPSVYGTQEEKTTYVARHSLFLNCSVYDFLLFIGRPPGHRFLRRPLSHQAGARLLPVGAAGFGLRCLLLLPPSFRVEEPSGVATTFSVLMNIQETTCRIGTDAPTMAPTTMPTGLTAMPTAMPTSGGTTQHGPLQYSFLFWAPLVVVVALFVR